MAATHTRPLICPGPGVAISSARHDAGTCPSTSGAPRTRERQRPNCGRPFAFVDAIQVIGNGTGFGNIRQPGRSKLPVTIASTSTSHDASVPNSWLHRPMRP